MTDMIGCCGLNCSKCEAYIATQADDDAMREETARIWRGHGGRFTAERINCSGCHADDYADPDQSRATIFFLWTDDECSIRKCCRDRSVSTCAECDEYLCERLKSFPHFTPEMKANLDGLRK
ncbi:DUF3795 domain-containing protein [Candidatus Hydrogenedentota bacterium]